MRNSAERAASVPIVLPRDRDITSLLVTYRDTYRTIRWVSELRRFQGEGNHPIDLGLQASIEFARDPESRAGYCGTTVADRSDFA